MNSRDSKSSRELKQEVIDELNKVNSDLDRIQGRLTPGQFIDDTVFRPVGNNPRAIFDHLAANPVGTAFLGLGTLLLMENESHVSNESFLKSKAGSAVENARYQATLLKGTAENVEEKIGQTVSGYTDRLQDVSNKVQNSIIRVKDKVQNLKGKLPHETGEASLGSGGEMGASSLDELKENFTDVKSFATREMETVRNLEPLTLVAIGAGLGALTGIAVPVSGKEQKIVDGFSGPIGTFRTEFQDALNQSVKVLRDELIGRFSAVDVNIFGKKSAQNETFRPDQSA